MAAIANIQYDKNQVVIFSKLYLYGSQANEQIGKLIIEEINRMYNEPNGTASIKGNLLQVVFDISYEIILWLQEEVLSIQDTSGIRR